MIGNERGEYFSGDVVSIVNEIFPARKMTSSGLVAYRQKGFLSLSEDAKRKWNGVPYKYSDILKLCAMLQLKHEGVAMKLSAKGHMINQFFMLECNGMLVKQDCSEIKSKLDKVILIRNRNLRKDEVEEDGDDEGEEYDENEEC